MPTTEERLAALETKLAALTDTTPTNYYTHQYSGEEIDAAVGRAVTGGALDTSVTNVSNQLGTFVRPNLLDNWYFGNPVDQRGGKIIPAGIPYYTTPDITLPEVGKTDKAYTVIGIKNYSGYGQRATISISGSVYYVWDQYAVRGYTGNGYGVDRWKSWSDKIQMTIVDGGLTVLTTSENATEIIQLFEQPIPAGTKLTISAVISKPENSGTSGIIRVKYSDNTVGIQANIPLRPMDHEVVSLSGNAKLDVTGAIIRPATNGPITIHAIKLELGPTQTLAHREGDRWVLNEVPDYGEQLRRCQRYYYQVHYAQYETIGFAYDGPEYAFIILPLPTEMRGATPTLKIIGDINIGGKVRTLTGCSCHGCEAIIGVNYAAQPSSTGATYAYSTSAGGVTISIIYDL